MAAIGGGVYVPPKKGGIGGFGPGLSGKGYGGGASGGGGTTATVPKIPTFEEVFGSGSSSSTAKAVPPKKGKGGGGAGGAGGAGGTGGPVANTAQISPYLQSQIDRYEGRFDVDNTKRAIDKATLGAMDAAAIGARDLGAANAARRGISGTGTSGAFLSKHFYEPAQRQAAGAAADIAMQRERDLDALTLGGTSLMRAPDDVSLANRDLALRQDLGEKGIGLQQSGLNLQQQQAQQAMQQQQMAQYLALINMMMPT